MAKKDPQLDSIFETLLGTKSHETFKKLLPELSPEEIETIEKSVEPIEENPQGNLSQKNSTLASDQSKTSTQEILLEDLVGQVKAKQSLQKIIALAKVNQERKRRQLPELKVNLHAIYSGSPGTGKTTFARFYAQEIKKLGILKKGHLIETSREDLVGEYKGQTAIKTREVIEKAKGGILFIDEAYALKNAKDDSYGQEAIDTLVKAIEDLRDEMVVILAGYTDEMREFLHHNPGLKSRIPHGIEFEDFTTSELMAIFDKMKEKMALEIEPAARDLVEEKINLARKGKSFGNAREVRNLLDQALSQQAIRLAESDLSQVTPEELSMLIYSDLTEDLMDRGSFEELIEKLKEQAPTSPLAELMKLEGLAEVKQEIRALADFIKVTQARQKTEILSDLNAHMIFSGNPGTGKSTVARLLGKIFQEIGYLSSGHLVEVDRSGLVAEYSGQTAVKTKEKIEDARGGVLFIDEAYTLYRGGMTGDAYGQEAIDTLLKYMEDYRGEMVVILAGYPQEMQTFLQSNPGLKSRIHRMIPFPDFNESELRHMAASFALEKGFRISVPGLDELIKLVESQRKTEVHFANARNLRQLLESAYKRQAQRMLALGDLDKIEAQVLETLEAEDFKDS